MVVQFSPYSPALDYFPPQEPNPITKERWNGKKRGLAQDKNVKSIAVSLEVREIFDGFDGYILSLLFTQEVADNICEQCEHTLFDFP